MAIEDTPLIHEVRDIIKYGAKSVTQRWDLEIEAEGIHYRSLKLISCNIARDFAGSYTDAIELVAVFPAGKFHRKIYPAKENLIARIVKVPYNNFENSVDKPQDIINQPFRATLIDDGSLVAANPYDFALSEDALDMGEIVVAKFQLMDLAIDQLRMQTVGGIWPKKPPFEVLRHILTRISNGLALDDEFTIRGVDIYEPTNTSPSNQIIVDGGTKLTQLPNLIQKQWGGIYNAGLGFFLQRRNWYVYPLYDTKRFDKDKHTLTLINVPEGRFQSIERTFKVIPDNDDPDQVTILVTGPVKHIDDSEMKQLNEGNGIQYGQADVLFNDSVVITGNKAVAYRKDTTTEYKSNDRKTELDNVQVSNNRITSNNYYQASILARRQGAHIQCKWENSDPYYIYPGMPVKYLYSVDSEVFEQVGIVTGCETEIGTSSVGMAPGRYFCNTVLTLFVARALPWAG